jgi:hypothetical protein
MLCLVLLAANAIFTRSDVSLQEKVGFSLLLIVFISLAVGFSILQAARQMMSKSTSLQVVSNSAVLSPIQSTK